MTVDGKVSTNALTPSGFTSRHDKHRLLEIRALGDAVLVGRNTLQTDDMSMGLPDQTLREARLARGQKEYPLRVVVSRSGNFPGNLKIFRTHDSPIIIYSTNLIRNREALEKQAALHLFGEEDLDLGAVLAHLYESYQVRTLVCEGGPTLAKSLARADAVDQLFLTVAPRLFGGGAAPGILGGPGDYLPASRNYRMLSMEIIGNECYLHYASDRSPCIN
jgi:riboflavin-specific deaminase-like protein